MYVLNESKHFGLYMYTSEHFKMNCILFTWNTSNEIGTCSRLVIHWLRLDRSVTWHTFTPAYKPVIHTKHHGTTRNINLPLCITTQLNAIVMHFCSDWNWTIFGNYYWTQQELNTIKEFRCYETKVEKGAGVKLSGCRGSVAEHWQPRPDVSWVRLNSFLCLVIASNQERIIKSLL